MGIAPGVHFSDVAEPVVVVIGILSVYLPIAIVIQLWGIPEVVDPHIIDLHPLGPDVGIDGIVEQVRANEATGRWISLQIKSGDRFFRESGPEGVVFRDERRHLDYYRSHQLPVVVVLHYPGTDDAIWQWVSPETVVETPRGYKVLVPHGQKLDATAATEWAHRLGRRQRTHRLS